MKCLKYISRKKIYTIITSFIAAVFILTLITCYSEDFNANKNGFSYPTVSGDDPDPGDDYDPGDDLDLEDNLDLGDDPDPRDEHTFNETHYLKQTPRMCGAASFFMIFKYYGDINYERSFFGLTDCSDIDHEWSLFEDISILTENSGVSKWLDIGGHGIDCEDLYEKIEALSIESDNGCVAYYKIDGNCRSAGVQEKRQRFDYILENFLNNYYPVIVYLQRPTPIIDIGLIQFFSGHYIIIVMYDEESGKVFYVDPNKEDDEDVIQDVGYEDFITKKWYTNGYPDAKWDGTWIGFYRE